MRHFILILMLIICGSNVLSALSFEKEDHYTNLSTSSQVKENRSVQITHSHVASESENGIPCDSESCHFHRCHLGHCSFITVPAVSYCRPVPITFNFNLFEEYLASAYLSFPTEPPRV